jgi:hypothetical protein
LCRALAAAVSLIALIMSMPRVSAAQDAAPLGQPRPLAPVGAVASPNVVFQWTHVPGSTWYLLWLSGLNSEFAYSQWFDAAAVCADDGCAVDPGLSLLSGTYSWWVQPWNAQVLLGELSAEAVFSVTIAPRAAVLTAPTGGSVDASPTFTWELVPGVTWYHLWLSDVTLPTGLQVHERWYAAADVCDFDADVCSVEPPLVLPGGAYKWWVRTWNAEGGYGEWSAPSSFTIDLAPAVPVPIAPTETMTSRPKFVWSRVPGATHYFVWLNGPNGFITQRSFAAESVCDPRQCSVDLGLTLSAGRHTWFVRAYNPYGGLSAWSAEVSVEVNIVPNGVIGVSPSGTINTAMPAFVWQHVTDASWYLVWIVDANGSTVHQQWFSRDAAGCLDDSLCSGAVGVMLAEGSYRWFVRSANASGVGAWSPQMTFIIDVLTPNEHQPGAPATAGEGTIIESDGGADSGRDGG